MRHVAVIDVGKTNAKLALVDLADLSEIAVLTRPNRVLPGPPFPQYDLDGHWRFFCDGLRAMHRDHGIDGISVTTHGAAVTLIGHEGRALPMPDYEHRGPEAVAADYDALRPPFAQTGSPRLNAGLNAGAQLHWMFATDPGLRARVRHVVTYPGYWGYRLTGALACDVTSLGSHTDLWLPREGRYSPLVDRLGIGDAVAPPRHPTDRLGTLAPAAAEETGLPAGLPVSVGIHDSNASLYPHLLAEPGPFSVVSTGTWVIAMTVGGLPGAIDPRRDTLLNVNARGEAVPSARFMGGREFDEIDAGWRGAPSRADRAAVLDRSVHLLPSVVRGSGPFPEAAHRWTQPPEGPGQRQVALAFYLASMTHVGLELTGARGPCIVEGPLARNAHYLDMLATLRPEEVRARPSATGTSTGAALLLAQDAPRPDPGSVVAATGDLIDHGREWSNLAGT